MLMSKTRALMLMYFFVGAFLLISAPKVSAHETQFDGDISVTMHIEPNDIAIAGTRQTLEFFVRDNTQKFDPAHCECVVTIHQGANTVATLATNVKDGSLRADYTFSKPAKYHLTITGSPTGTADFEDFTDSYTIEVTDNKSSVTAYAIYGLLVASIVTLLAVVLLSNRRR